MDLIKQVRALVSDERSWSTQGIEQFDKSVAFLAPNWVPIRKLRPQWMTAVKQSPARFPIAST